MCCIVCQAKDCATHLQGLTKPFTPTLLHTLVPLTCGNGCCHWRRSYFAHIRPTPYILASNVTSTLFLSLGNLSSNTSNTYPILTAIEVPSSNPCGRHVWSFPSILPIFPQEGAERALPQSTHHIPTHLATKERVSPPTVPSFTLSLSCILHCSLPSSFTVTHRSN